MLTLAAPFTLTRSSRITSVERALGALEHSLEVGTNSEDSAPAPVKGVLLKKKPTLSSNPLGWDTRAFRAADYKLAWWGAEISAFPGGERPKDFFFDAPGYKDGTWNEAFITACKATAGSYPTTVDGIRLAAAPDTYACFQLFTTTFGGGTEKDLLAFANAVDDWLQVRLLSSSSHGSTSLSDAPRVPAPARRTRPSRAATRSWRRMSTRRGRVWSTWASPL